MRDSILTIPISELFEPKTGCPICRMRDTLEQRTVEYIMGAAMMEPDVRQETNQLGFCNHHMHAMQHCNNRLSLALMTQTRLDTIRQTLQSRPKLWEGKQGKKKKLSAMLETCFVCSKIDWGMERLLTTMFELFADAEFRALFAQQEQLCLPHYDLLLTLAPQQLSKQLLPEFEAACAALVQKQLNTLYEDVSHFCNMYDYRHAGPDADWGNSRDSIERAVAFLTGRE